jgi:hypothetical protein
MSPLSGLGIGESLLNSATVEQSGVKIHGAKSKAPPCRKERDKDGATLSLFNLSD